MGLLTLTVAITLSLRAVTVVAYKDDPDAHRDVMQLITSKGYPAEEHYVTTPDGYILCLHRIPYGLGHREVGGNQSVAFLQHGIIGSSADWVINLANQSLGYILADAGHDVWLGNIRGNVYSRNHTTLNPKQKEFWDFSFDEHALVDLPAMLDYVLNVTGQSQVFYVGHSQGTIMGFAGFSTSADLASKVKAFFALAPITTVKHVEGALHYFAPFYKELEFLINLDGTGEFLPTASFMDYLTAIICPLIDVEYVCEDILFLICGFDRTDINITRLEVYVTHTPAGTSVRNVVHWSQMIRSGLFCMYDYGSPNANMEHYGVPNPPNYNITQLQVPTALFSGGNDWVADPTDVAALTSELVNTTIGNVVIPQYDHMDFIWGLDAASVVYQQVLAIMKQSR
eukprot:Em0021g342a